MLDAGNPNRRGQAPVLGLYPRSSILIGPGGPLDPTGRDGWPIAYSAQPRSPVVDMQVKIDSVVLDSGNALGPDNRQVVKKLREHIRAQQDLAHEISGRLERGELLPAVLADLSAKLPQDNDFRRGVHSKDLPTLYLSVRQSYLHGLATTYANLGEAAAMLKLKELTFTVRPTIQL